MEFKKNFPSFKKINFNNCICKKCEKSCYPLYLIELLCLDKQKKIYQMYLPRISFI
jgi:hypothetical protein